MPSVIVKKSVEGFGISFIEAASFGKGSIGAFMVEKQTLLSKMKLVCYVMEII